MKIKIDNPSQWDQPLIIEGTPTPLKQGTSIRFVLANEKHQVVIDTTEDELTEFA